MAVLSKYRDDELALLLDLLTTMSEAALTAMAQLRAAFTAQAAEAEMTRLIGGKPEIGLKLTGGAARWLHGVPNGSSSASQLRRLLWARISNTLTGCDTVPHFAPESSYLLPYLWGGSSRRKEQS